MDDHFIRKSRISIRQNRSRMVYSKNPFRTYEVVFQIKALDTVEIRSETILDNSLDYWRNRHAGTPLLLCYLVCNLIIRSRTPILLYPLFCFLLKDLSLFLFRLSVSQCTCTC